MNDDFDWMDNAEAQQTAQSPALGDTPTRPELRTEIAAIPVSVPQKYFIDLLTKSDDRLQCERALVLRYPSVALQLEQWWDDDDFLDALQKKKLRGLVKRRVTKADVLADVRDTIDKCLEPQPILFKGMDTGFTEIKAGEAFRGLELLGKATKAWDDKDSVNVVVGVELLDWSGDGARAAIDVTPQPRAADEE